MKNWILPAAGIVLIAAPEDERRAKLDHEAGVERARDSLQRLQRTVARSGSRLRRR